IAHTIGRLPYRTEAEIRQAERVMLDIADRAASPAAAGKAAAADVDTPMRASAPVLLAGVAHGFEALARRAVKLGSLSADARRRLRPLARYEPTVTVPAAQTAATQPSTTKADAATRSIPVPNATGPSAIASAEPAVSAPVPRHDHET